VAGFTGDAAPPVRAVPESVKLYAALRARYADFEARQLA
jgi:hypothetical protein